MVLAFLFVQIQWLYYGKRLIVLHMILFFCLPMYNILCVSLHSKGLTSARRSINKDCAILTFQKCVTERLTLHFWEDLLLSRLRIEHFFERVNFLFVASDVLSYTDLGLGPVYNWIIDDFDTDGVTLLVGDLRAHSGQHINRHICLLLLCFLFLGLVDDLSSFELFLIRLLLIDTII